MALETTITEENTQGRLQDEEEKDLKIMVNLGKDMIDEGGYSVVEQALNSKDPGVVIGQFLMQLGSQMGEQLPFDPSPRIMLARGGWLEQMSDYMQEEYDVPKKDMDRAEMFVASSAQGMAQSQQQQQAPQQAAVQPPLPAQEVTPNG